MIESGHGCLNGDLRVGLPKLESQAMPGQVITKNTHLNIAFQWRRIGDSPWFRYQHHSDVTWRFHDVKRSLEKFIQINTLDENSSVLKIQQSHDNHPDVFSQEWMSSLISPAVLEEPIWHLSIFLVWKTRPPEIRFQPMENNKRASTAGQTFTQKKTVDVFL